MGYFTKRERAELNKVEGVEGEVPDFVRQRESLGAQRENSGAEDQRVAHRLGSLIGQVAGNSIREIDNVTAGLRALRGQLESQGERVQREVIEYATLSQSTMESTKIISEQLAKWKKSQRAPRAAESPSPDLVPSSDSD